MLIRSRMFGLLALLLALVAGTIPPVEAQADAPAWSQVAGVPASVEFTSVVLLDPANAWATGVEGSGGVIYRLQFAGGRWSASLEQRADQLLAALSVIAADNIWAVGDGGLLLHKSSQGWFKDASPVPGARLTTIQMFGQGEEGWVGGYVPPTPENGGEGETVLLHYRDGGWERDASLILPGQIRSLHFAGGGGWAVGDSRIWRWDGSAWQAEATPPPCGPDGCYGTYAAVRAISADEAWAVGHLGSICAACSKAVYYIARRSGGQWGVQSSAFANRVPGAPLRKGAPIQTPLHGLVFSDSNHGLAVGYVSEPGVIPQARPMVFRFRDGAWSHELAPVIDGVLNGVTMLDDGHALAVGSNGIILSYGYGQQPPARPLPTARVADPRNPDILYFPAVGHTLSWPFKDYWQGNGGLPVFGYPLTEAFGERSADSGDVFPVQYFERQRLEYHYENYGTPYEILLGRLGAELLELSGRRNFPPADPASPHYYPESGQAIAPEFWEYWRSHGLEFGDPGVSAAESLALFGYPISPPALETNSSGDTVLTQWFERARFEYHPDNPAGHRVLLGRLAAELLAARGW